MLVTTFEVVIAKVRACFVCCQYHKILVLRPTSMEKLCEVASFTLPRLLCMLLPMECGCKHVLIEFNHFCLVDGIKNPLYCQCMYYFLLLTTVFFVVIRATCSRKLINCPVVMIANVSYVFGDL